MSKETTIQSKSLIEEVGFCSADPADFEDQVCAPEPEYYYDPVNQICAPEPVVKVEYKQIKKGKIEKIVTLDEKKILANRAKAFEPKPIQEPGTKDEGEVGVEIQTGEKQSTQIPVLFQSSPIQVVEVLGELIEAHEVSILQLEGFIPPRLYPSAEICFDCLWDRSEARRSTATSRSVQVAPVREGCVEPEREPLYESLPILLGATLLSLARDIRASIMERIVAEQTRGREIDYILFGFPIASALSDPQLYKENAEREGEKETKANDNSAPPLAPLSRAMALAVFSAEDLQALPEGSGFRSGDTGAFLVFHFEGISVFDHSHSALVVLPPAWVTPRELEGNGRAGGKTNDLATLHTKVERGSPSQSSRDSRQGEGEGDQGSNQRQPFEEWLTL